MVWWVYRAYAYSINILSSKNLIFDKKLNLLEK